MMVYMDIPSWSFIAVGQVLLHQCISLPLLRDTLENREHTNNHIQNTPIPTQVDSNTFDFASYDNPFLTWILDVFM